jgi:hypothetical protein
VFLLATVEKAARTNPRFQIFFDVGFYMLLISAIFNVVATALIVLPDQKPPAPFATAKQP